MFQEDEREFPKILSLRVPQRCANFPCRAERAPGDRLYCAKCREDITAEAWLRIQSEPLPR